MLAKPINAAVAAPDADAWAAASCWSAPVLCRLFAVLYLLVMFPGMWFLHSASFLDGEGCGLSCVPIPDAANEIITYHPWGWWSVFLTEWGGQTQLLYFAGAFLCAADMAPAGATRHLDRFFTLVWPLGVFIGMMFYGMVFPGIIASSSAGECGHEYPATVNRTDVCGLNGTMPCAKSSCEGVAVGAGIFGCLQHGVPMLFILLEGRLQPHVYGAWPAELAIVVAYASSYIGWNQIVHYKNGCWPYPFQQQLEAPITQAAYIIVLLLFIVGLYFVGRRCSCFAKRREG